MGSRIQYGFWSADGRISRKVFCLRYAFPAFLLFIFAAIIVTASLSFQYSISQEAINSSAGYIEKNPMMQLVLTLVAFFASVAVLLSIYIYTIGQIKRMHDLNRSGKICFINFFLPVIGLIITSSMAFFCKGDVGTNEYGHDPRGSRRMYRK